MEEHSELQEFEVSSEYEGERLDKFLAAIYQDQSRSFFQKLIREEQILVNGSAQKVSFRLGTEDLVQVTIPKAQEIPILAENIPLDILYEDQELLVVNKPKGMVVHPSAGHYSGTLVNAVMFHCQESLSGINGIIRPGIVHRIDMDTTGALIVCKNDNSHVKIAAQIKEHSVTRKYRGIVNGIVKQDQGRIEGAIGRHPSDRKKMAVNERTGKPAVTHYRVITRFERHTYMEFQLETGRTHQIRVHMASIGHPLLGDAVYGNAKSCLKTGKGNPVPLQGQTLHAAIIGFVHPVTGVYQEIQAQLPDYFQELLTKNL